MAPASGAAVGAPMMGDAKASASAVGPPGAAEQTAAAPVNSLPRQIDPLAPAQLVHLTSLADVNRLLHEAVARERSIEEELDARLAMRQDLERRLSALQRTAAPLLDAAASDARRLAHKAGAAAQQADRISGGVRRLDAAATRVSACLELVRSTAERAACADAAEAAVASGDLPSGALAAARFRELDALLSPGAAARAAAQLGQAGGEGGGQGEKKEEEGQEEEEEEDPVDAAAANELRQRAAQAGAQLEAGAARRLDAAARAGDRGAVLRAAALYAPLGLRERGLARYAAYVRGAAGDAARASYGALSDALDKAAAAAAASGRRGRPAPVPGAGGAEFVDALTASLRGFAMATEEDEDAVREAFGPAAAAALVKAVQLECDAQATRVLARLDEARRLSRMVDEAAAARAAAAQGRSAPPQRGGGGAGAGAGAGGGGGGGPEPRRVEGALQEVAVLLQRAAEYEGFMVSKLRAAADRADAAADATDAAELGMTGAEGEKEKSKSGGGDDSGSGSGSGSGSADEDEEGEDADKEDADDGDDDGGPGEQRRRRKKAGGGGKQEEKKRKGPSARQRRELAARREARRAQRQRDEAAFRSGSFSVAVRELVGRYVSLEEYYLESTVALAIRLDQVAAGPVSAAAAAATAAAAAALGAGGGAAPPPVGSVVDDAFFVARKAGGRALSCGSAQAACAALGALNDVLANDLRAALAGKLATAGGGLGAVAPPPSASAPAAAAAAAARVVAAAAARAAAEGWPDLTLGPDGPAARAACAAVNNADVAAEYSGKLHAELDAYADRIFGAFPRERSRLRSVLEDLARTGRALAALAAGAAEAVAGALLARLRPALDAAVPAGRAAMGAEQAAAGGGGGGEGDDDDGEGGAGDWAPPLAAALAGLLGPVRASLVPGAYEATVAALLEGVASRIEAAVLSKRGGGGGGAGGGGGGRGGDGGGGAGAGGGFTQLGGLQLERDVRALVAACAPLSTRTVRDKFARLSQMATALSVETVAEFGEYYGDGAAAGVGGGGGVGGGAGGAGAGGGGIAWRLAPGEVRAVLALRGDFTREAIEALPL